MTGTALNNTSLIFEGGGMRCAYTAGVVRVLVEAGIDFPWVAGISAGASLACHYIARSPETARRGFVDIATDPQWGSWRTFASGQGYFNGRYIYHEAPGPQGQYPFPWEQFCANPADVRIAGFDVETGEQVWWSKADAPQLDDLMVRVHASSAVPILMPPVQVDGRTYVDGALGGAGGIALDRARSEGFTRHVIVLSQPRSYRKPPQRALPYIRRRYRHWPAVGRALADRHERYNAMRADVFAAEARGEAYVFAPRTMPISQGERSVAKLEDAYTQGLAQARTELPQIREFLGL